MRFQIPETRGKGAILARQSEFQALDARHQIPDTRFQIPETRDQIRETRDKRRGGEQGRGNLEEATPAPLGCVSCGGGDAAVQARGSVRRPARRMKVWGAFRR